jgi:tetratricopeptide (TPR) repeat protein
MKPKIAMALIVKASDDKEAASLAQALGSVNGYVDAIYIQLNARKGKKISKAVRAVADNFADFVYEYEWQDNFVKARQDVFDKVPKEYDWITWMDSDDKIENPENISQTLAIMPEDVNGVYILYDYQKDEFGNVIVSHWATRAVRNNDSFAWKSSFDDDEVAVHETLVARRTGKAVANDEWKVVHNVQPEHYKESLIRNIELLEGMAQRQAKTEKGIDPRILFYLGSHYNEAYRYNEALDLFIEYLKVSGWSEERAEAHIFVGRILKNKGKLVQARNAFLQAMGENPKNPGAYLELGKLESKSERWEQAAEWLKRGIDIKRDISPMVRYNYDFELYTHYAQALANLGGKHLSKALKMAQEALKLRPYDEDAKENRDRIQKLIDHRNNMRGVARLLKALDEEEKYPIPFVDSLPDTMQDSNLVIETRHKYLPAKVWDKKSIAIYVGMGPLGIWGPWSLDEGGIGGSEEAVVRLSNELAELGWQVTVFGMPGKRAGYYPVGSNKMLMSNEVDDFRNPPSGVQWRHYWEINNKDTFDVLISWRQPGFFDFKWQARKTYLWLHDVVEKDELTPERLTNITKVIYVSKYHSTRPENADIKPSQKLASGNGIDPSSFAKYDGESIQRDNHRVIYMSANERGLRILLDIWPDVLRDVPDASLTPYYGWQSFDAVNRDNPERMAWKATMVARMKELPGVSESVRLGHDELTQEMFKSGVFAYPCFFPEVSCITAMKAQCAGLYPVTSTFANMDNVIISGTKVDMDDFSPEDVERYKKALIHALKHPPTGKERKSIADKARKEFTWSGVALQWSEEMS